MPSPARPTSVQKQIEKHQEDVNLEDPTLELMGSLSLAPTLPTSDQQPVPGLPTSNPPGSGPTMSSMSRLGTGPMSPPAQPPPPPQRPSQKSNKDMSQWFSLFADLDPLANPDAIGKSTKEQDPNCYS